MKLVFVWLSLVASKILPKCLQLRERKNIVMMTQNELQTYFRAVEKLHAGPSPSRWDYYAKIHIEQYENVHSDPKFLIWHRMMLYALERDLQVHEPNVTLPYWDWTVHYNNTREDPVLSSSMFGGPGDSQTGCIKDGMYKSFYPYYWHEQTPSSHCLRRNHDLFSKVFTNPVVLDRNYLSQPDMKTFASKLEGVPHGTAHNNIGGEFSGRASPGDPLFYAHHTFVDKLWYDWQKRHPRNYHDYPLSRKYLLQPWNVPVGEVVDPHDLCYFYQNNHFSWSNPPESGVSTFSAKAPQNRKPSGRNLFSLPKFSSIFKILPDPLPISFLNLMKMNVTAIRQQEREDALLLQSLF